MAVKYSMFIVLLSACVFTSFSEESLLPQKQDDIYVCGHENLYKNIHFIIQMYSMENSGRFPKSLKESFDYMGGDKSLKSLFKCPGRAHDLKEDKPDEMDSWVDYIYIYWSEGVKTPSEYPLVFDKRLSNHKGKGINILLVGHKYFWDENAKWLMGFVKKHPELKIQLPELESPVF